VRETGGVGDFTGAAGKPIPMKDEEIRKMLGQEVKKDEPSAPKIKMQFATGDRVKIKEGGFDGFEGMVDKIDETSGKVSVLVEIFGRSTPVELEYWQIERI
jgi:transcriptional antiterminator NusG